MDVVLTTPQIALDPTRTDYGQVAVSSVTRRPSSNAFGYVGDVPIAVTGPNDGELLVAVRGFHISGYSYPSPLAVRISTGNVRLDDPTAGLASTRLSHDPSVLSQLEVSWGDGTPIQDVPVGGGAAYHGYDAAGSYTVAMRARFSNSSPLNGDAEPVAEIVVEVSTKTGRR